MGIVFRQSIKSTLVTFAGAALGALITYAGTRVFTMQELGFTRTLINISAIIQSIVLLGGGHTLSVFMQRYDGHDPRRKTLLAITAIVPLLVTILFTIPFLAFKNDIVGLYNSDDQQYISTYYYFVPLLVLPWGYMTLFDLYLISAHKTAAAAFVREIVLRIINIAVMTLFFYGIFKFHLVIYGIVCMYTISAFLLLIISMRTKGFGFSFKWSAFSKQEYKEIIHFAWYHLLVGVTFYMMGYIDTIMLAPLDKTGMRSVAIYTIASFIISIMVIPYRAMTLAAFPSLNRAYIDNDHHTVHDLFRRSTVNILVIGVAMFLIIGANLHNAVAILPEGYKDTAALTFILMAGRLIDMASGLNSELISISKYYKFNFRISVLLLVAVIILNRLLIPAYGVYGAAWSATISLFLFNAGKMIFLKQKMQVSTFSRKNIFVLIAGVLVLVPVHFIPVIGNPVTDTIIRTIIVCIAYGLLLFWLRPSEDLNTYIASIRKNKRLF